MGFEHEQKKIKYLHSWTVKQGAKFTDIDSVFKIRWVKEKDNKATINFSEITEYAYEYENKQGFKSPQDCNLSCYGYSS